MKCFCGKKKLRLLHKVACRLNIHDDKWVFEPQMKRTWFQAQIKQDIVISAQFEHEMHSTHKRGSCIAFLQKKAIHKHIHPKATKSTAIHLMRITSKSSACIQHIMLIKVYRRSTSLEHMIQMQPMIQRCKHHMKMQHAYVHEMPKPNSKRQKSTKLTSSP
jgi:hypothetical protein